MCGRTRQLNIHPFACLEGWRRRTRRKEQETEGHDDGNISTREAAAEQLKHLLSDDLRTCQNLLYWRKGKSLQSKVCQSLSTRRRLFAFFLPHWNLSSSSVLLLLLPWPFELVSEEESKDSADAWFYLSFGFSLLSLTPSC